MWQVGELLSPSKVKTPALVPGFRRFRGWFFGLKVTLTCTIEPNFFIQYACVP